MTDFRQQLASEGWGLTVQMIAKPKGTIDANTTIQVTAGVRRPDGIKTDR